MYQSSSVLSRENPQPEVSWGQEKSHDYGHGNNIIPFIDSLRNYFYLEYLIQHQKSYHESRRDRPDIKALDDLVAYNSYRNHHPTSEFYDFINELWVVVYIFSS